MYMYAAKLEFPEGWVWGGGGGLVLNQKHSVGEVWIHFSGTTQLKILNIFLGKS